MPRKTYDAEYDKKLKEYFDASLPEKIYDAHFHISRRYTKNSGYQGEPFSQYTEYMENSLGRKISGGLVMPPTGIDPYDVFMDEKAYTLSVARENNLDVGLLVKPGCGKENTVKTIQKNPEIKALKPYMNYSVKENFTEADILDYAPEWMWEIADEREMPVVIHLSHYQDMLSAPQNISQLRYISKKYKRAKIILAHCAMGHHVHKLKLGLSEISDLENIWVDCSGSAEAMSIYYCLKTFGVNRMMYGGDYNAAEVQGRICSIGSNFIGIYDGYLKEDVIPGAFKYQPISFGEECLLALLQASEILDLKENDMEKIFYNNATELFKR